MLGNYEEIHNTQKCCLIMRNGIWNLSHALKPALLFAVPSSSDKVKGHGVRDTYTDTSFLMVKRDSITAPITWKYTR